MKHLTASWWKRAAATADLVGEDVLRAEIRARLDGTDAGKLALARELGITVLRLTRVVRGTGVLPDRAVKRLGYRKVVRFERVE